MKGKKIVSDIRFWIILFFILRLYGITNPPLDVAHSWRQTTVAMAARNFLEVNNNIFYPRIDIAGNLPGITGMEFPILNYLIYMGSEIFGYEHWYGRLINLIVSSFGLLFFYKLIKKYATESLAFKSTIILLFSIWFAYSRKIMPDTFSISFMIMALYYSGKYLHSKTQKLIDTQLLLFSLLTLIACTSKLPSGYLLILLCIPFLDKSIKMRRKVILGLVLLCSIIPALIWYFYWVPHLVETFGFWHFFMGKNIGQGLEEIVHVIPKTFKVFYEGALKYSGFVLFIFGLTMITARRNKNLAAIVILTTLGFTFFMLKAGNTFANHAYYVIPFVPIMALVAAYGLEQISNKKVQYMLLAFVAVEGILNQQHDFRIRDKEAAILNLENDLNALGSSDELILINSGYDPAPMYFAHRKGWVNTNGKLMDVNYVDSLKNLGLKNIVVLKRTMGTEVELKYESVLNNEDYCIYKLE